MNVASEDIFVNEDEVGILARGDRASLILAIHLIGALNSERAEEVSTVENALLGTMLMLLGMIWILPDLLSTQIL